MIKNEWKNLLHNKIMFVVVIAIIAIPIIYAGLFLKSMWDPYGNVDHLPVAVVNEDKPVDYDGTTLSVGKDMVEELRENDSMAFNFVDSRTAEDGLENGTYYMVITIPEDFSANAATLMDDEVGMDDIVEVYFEEDDEIEKYKLVTSIRGNSMENRISIESPIGMALKGHKVGDRVEVKVNDNYSYFLEIRSIDKTGSEDEEIRGF